MYLNVSQCISNLSLYIGVYLNYLYISVLHKISQCMRFYRIYLNVSMSIQDILMYPCLPKIS